ncbi:MAG: glycosyl transferase family 1, partial [[Chlorobium] sp. 445]
PEVLGGAGVLGDPADPADIARAMRAILDDPAYAAVLRGAGLARAQQFAPERVIAAMRQVYTEVRR